MTDITIPPEALEAAAKAMFTLAYRREPIENTDEGKMELARQYVRAACLAMLKAWPGAEWLYVSEPVLALPMPTENSND